MIRVPCSFSVKCTSLTGWAERRKIPPNFGQREKLAFSVCENANRKLPNNNSCLRRLLYYPFSEEAQRLRGFWTLFRRVFKLCVSCVVSTAIPCSWHLSWTVSQIDANGSWKERLSLPKWLRSSLWKKQRSVWRSSTYSLGFRGSFTHILDRLLRRLCCLF